MSRLFDDALKSRCEADPDVAPLGAQWEFDRRLISNALAGIALTYPHYSRHDASHSNMILLQLARLMGRERINTLSATDLWLLLEAAYHHDLGMVLTDEEARQIWTSKNFEIFSQQALTSPDIDLRIAAELTRNRLTDSSLATWPLDVRRAVVQLLAEFVRRQHAGRSGAFARNPGLIGLESPRTGLLPARLFGLLGDICHSHGQSFQDALALPRETSGMGTDNANPRFVACMLRIGDLLDLDNGRFCPVLQRVSGKIPTTSLAHIEKHASIRHVLVSPELIEVDAECDTYPGYEVTWQWLDWLQKEIQSQMLKWNEIAPRGFGPLPSLGRIEARQKNYLALQPGQRPRFEVDREATLKLLRGANLYPRPEDAIQELVQNAIDATLLRLWLETWSRLSSEQLQAMGPQDIRREIASYPIDVSFERLNQGTEWRISIQDHGTGIAFADLRYLLTVGSSQKNPQRSQIIQQMPEWMRPSGIFGIGLQSVFLLTREVVLLTRYYDTGEAYEITLRSSEVDSSSGLLIRRLEGGERAATIIGTQVVFTVQTGRFPTTTIHDNESSTANKLLGEFDPILNEEMPYFVTRVKDLLSRLASECLCPLQLDGSPITSKYKQETLRFDRISGCELAFDFDFIETGRSSNNTSPRTSTRYRGAPVSDFAEWPLVAISCNAHIGRADKFLTLDRQRLTQLGVTDLYQRVNDALQRLLPQLLVRLRNESSAQIKVASLLAHTWGLLDAGDEWKEIKIRSWKLQITKSPLGYSILKEEGEVESIALGELVGRPRVVYQESMHLNSPRLWVLSAHDNEVNITGGDGWVRPLLSRYFSHSSYDGEIDTKIGDIALGELYVYDKNAKLDVLTDRGLLSVLVKRGVFKRATIPCPREFGALRVPVDDLPGFSHILQELQPRMINPFMVEKISSGESRIYAPRIATLVTWIHQHATEPRPPKAVIAETLLRFVRKVDQLLARDSSLRREYDLKRLEHDLDMSGS